LLQRFVHRIAKNVCLPAAVGVLASFLAGCGSSSSSPLEPGDSSAAGLGSTPLVVPDVLVKSIELIDNDTGIVPQIGEPTGIWLRKAIRGIVIDPGLPREVRAQCCGKGRVIHWSTGWLPDPSNPDDVRIAAAIIVHEARHAEGYPHTCPDGRRDRSFEEGGAWAVQAEWLRRMGDVRTANAIAALDIGCR
jgi:hypothetical protein